MALDSVHYCLTALLKSREWFWGVVLISLLIIGCVESNPGPRSNEVISKVECFAQLHISALKKRHNPQNFVQNQNTTGNFLLKIFDGISTLYYYYYYYYVINIVRLIDTLEIWL